jgi:uncharacterized protein YdeI (YjbR/CyaY-like superfamily)
MKTDHVKPRYFRSAVEFRRWLEKNHASANELWLGLYKKASDKKGITYKEAVDEGLCFGWIDGLVKGVDENSYMQRFTPRRPNSIWSAVNIKRIQELMEEDRVHEAGMKAFLERDPSRAGLYSFENEPQTLPKDQEKRFRAHGRAWRFFGAQPPGYRRAAIWWVVSAKRDDTKERRLSQLIEDSAAGRRVKHLAPTPKK